MIGNMMRLDQSVTLKLRDREIERLLGFDEDFFSLDQTGGFDPADPEPIRELEFDQSLPD